MDSPHDLEKMKDALQVIAEARQSERLLGFMKNGIDRMHACSAVSPVEFDCF